MSTACTRIEAHKNIFKNKDDVNRFSCTHCKSILQEPVQIGCGHRLCRSCADELIATEPTPTCAECKEEITEEDGAKYFPDRFVKREILSLFVICLFSESGCKWEGTYQDFLKHVHVCSFASSTCKHCGKTVRKSELESHHQSCPQLPRLCPLSTIGCSKESMVSNKLHDHMEDTSFQHFAMLVSRLLSLEGRLQEPGKANGRRNHTMDFSRSFLSRDIVETDGHGAGRFDSGVGQSLGGKTEFVSQLQDINTYRSMEPRIDQLKIESMLTGRMEEMKREMMKDFVAELKAKEDEIATLKATVTKMEKMIRLKSAEQEDRDFRLSLIENGNHDGSMIWKIPQFSQRKADAVSGKYTSIFSLPFYSGRYGYKMCLRLYIMGDGIGKGTHLSLFFVVMRGEFDNILQWPFTHKVTFKLINQAGGRDIVDTFQPDPLSSSFKKPTSDMNIASGCPRFVSHTELERGGFIVDDTVFIKCIINTVSIRHP